MPQRMFQALERFVRVEEASGIALLAAALAAVAWANSPWLPDYERLWLLPLRIGGGPLVAARTLRFWVNDGLMTVFFLVAGMEIRRELHDGALASARRAALPVAAALGGIIAPALIYLLSVSDCGLRQGWAVPTATDIAFAIGALALLGRRVPPALRALLLALAILDDIVAILVIAGLNSHGVALAGLLIAAAGVLGVLAFRWLGVRPAMAYVLPGCIIWFGLLRAGVHPTLAGVLLGLLTPVTASAGRTAGAVTVPPVVRVEAALHPWVAFGIMPLFALANAGISLDQVGSGLLSLASPAPGIFLGLFVGKPLGIVLGAAASVRAGWCELPNGVSWRNVLIMGFLGGIGFTMSIFIANLAFPAESQLAAAKLAVLLASAAAGIAAAVATWIPAGAGPPLARQ